MRVLVVSNMYPSPGHPAGGVFVHEQVKALRARGIDARVVTGKPLWLSGRRPRHALRLVRAERAARARPFAWGEHDGVPLAGFRYFAGVLARPWLYPLIYREGLRALLPGIERDFPYDLVHAHTAFLDGRAGAAAARRRGVPMVLTEHTGPFSLVTERFGLRVHARAGLAAADRVVAVSEALRGEIERRLPGAARGGALVIPNGVDAAFFDPAAPPPPRGGAGGGEAAEALAALRGALLASGEGPWGAEDLARAAAAVLAARARADEPAPAAGEGAVRALWIGHLVGVKRVDRLLDALAIARRHRPALRLTLVGGGPLEGSLRARAAALGLGDAVAFAGPADRAGVRRHLAACDVLVISSETETFGIVGIEALAMGQPVLSTACGGPADYLADPAHGELVGNTTEDLAIGLQRVADRLAGAPGAPGFDPAALRAHAAARFDFTVVAGRLAALYRELAPRAGAP